MKRYVRININGTEADIDAATLRLALDIAVETDEPGQVRGSYSKRAISLPGTSTNRDILEDIQHGTTVLTSSNQLLPVTVEADGIPILKGRVQLSQVIHRGQAKRVAEYKAAIYGNNADWFTQIKNKRIRDLGWSELTLDFATIEDAAKNNTWEDETTFGLVKWKDWDQGDAVTHLEHSVCLFIRWILYKAFRDLGYQLSGDFLDTDLFKRLVIPIPIRPYEEEYAEDVVNVRASESATQTFNDFDTEFVISFNDDSTFPNFDAGNNWDTSTDTYTAPADGYYKFTVSFSFDSWSSLSPPQTNYPLLLLKKNGTEIDRVQPFGNAYEYESDWTELSDGDTIQIIMLTGDSYPIEISETVLNVEYEGRDIAEGQTLDMQYQIPPQWTVKDVLLDLQRMFGLVIDTDPAAGVVTIEPRDKYTLRVRYPSMSETDYEGYYYSSSAIDITEDIDVSQDSTMDLMTDLTRYYVLDYAVDDETVGSLQETEGFRLYGGRYDFGENRFPAGETVVNTDFFTKTFSDTHQVITSTGSTATVYLPVIIDGNYRLSPSASEIPDDFGPHLLYHAGRRGGLDGSVNIYNTGTSATSAYDHPYLFIFNPLDPSGYDPSLAFSNETTDSGVEVPGLMQRFHLRHLARIEGGRKFEHYVDLDAVDVAELNFRFKRQIDGGNYLLERVDGYNPLNNRPTAIRLFKDEAPTSAHADKISRAILATSDSVAGGSGGSGTGSGGGGSGGGTGGGSGGTSTRWYRQWFYNQTTTTMTITENSGLLPTNEAQIELVDSSNGQVISPAYYSISGSVITLTFTPTGEDYYVRFSYP